MLSPTHLLAPGTNAANLTLLMVGPITVRGLEVERYE